MIYFISNNGVQNGPLTFEQLKEQEINNKTLVWKEGTSDWVKASEVEELVAILELMPPPVDAVSSVQDNEQEAVDAANKVVQRKVIDNTKMFSHLFSFRGRSRCAEYVFINVLSYVLTSMLFSVSDDNPILYVVFILLIWLCIAVGVRRCHDVGRTGFLILVPFFGIYLLFADSEPGDNKYGNNPKGVNFKGLY